jgi:hypothetical protein
MRVLGNNNGIPVIRTSRCDFAVDTPLAAGITASCNSQMNEKPSIFPKTIPGKRLAISNADSIRIGQIPESGMKNWNTGHRLAFGDKIS